MTSVPPRGDPALQSVSPTVLALWQHSARLRLVDGLLYRIYDTPQDPINQLVVPTAARSDVMKALHNDASSAHLGITKTLDKARRRYYWPGMSSDIENWIRARPICQARQGPNPKQAARLRSQQSSFPLQRVAMDIMGPLPTTARQNKYILVIGDYFTKWVEAFAMPDMLASTVARYFVDGFVCRYSVPLSLHTDQDPQFQSRLMKSVCRLLDITKTRTTAYHPQSDGMIERYNRTLQKMLSSCVDDHQEWDLHLQRTMFAYRTSVHSSTSNSPSLLMFGRELVLPLDILHFAESNTFNRRVEVLGFYSADVQHYIRKVLSIQHAGEILKQVECNPALATFVQIPVNAVGVCRLYRAGVRKLPTTLASLTSATLFLAIQQCEKKKDDPDFVDAKCTDWKQLAPDLSKPAADLAEFAYKTLIDQLFIFNKGHFKQYGLTPDARSLGLLTTSDFVGFANTPQWMFNHLSDQESLAALHIAPSLTTAADVTCLVHRLGPLSGHLNSFWRFLSSQLASPGVDTLIVANLSESRPAPEQTLPYSAAEQPPSLASQMQRCRSLTSLFRPRLSLISPHRS